MTKSREHIKNNIAAALKSAILPGASPECPSHTVPRATGGLEQFQAEAEKLSARVTRVASAQRAAQKVAELFREHDWQRVLAWTWEEIGCEGLGNVLTDAGVEVLHEASISELAVIPVGLTGADAALADTGTLVLRNGWGRSPLASLLPPVHIAVLDASRILPDMPTYFESLTSQGGAVKHVQATSNLVFISGPSRTADIEQTLTLGVHGPRELLIVLWG